MASKGRFWQLFSLLLLGGISLLLRLQHLPADPPRLLPDISGSAGIYFDEGIYGHNARNRILFGRWIVDEWNPMLYNAVLTGIYFLAFRLFGISMITVKCVTIAFGLLAVFLFYLALRRLLDPWPAQVVTWLFALNFYWLMYNRIGLLENFSALCFVLAFYLFVLAQGNDRWLFVTGLAVALAVLSKYLFAFFFLSVTLAVAYHCSRERRWRPLLWYLSGFFSLLLTWFLAIFLPFNRLLVKIGGGWGKQSLPPGIAQAWRNLLHIPLTQTMGLMPLLFLLVWLAASVILVELFRRNRSVQPAEVFVLLWLAGGILELGLLNYRPLRYFLPMLPAFFLMVGLLWRKRNDLSKALPWLFPLLALAIFWFLPFLRSLVRPPSLFFLFPLWLRILQYAMIIGLLAVLLFHRRSWQPAIAGFFCALMIISSLFLYFTQFYRQPEFNLEKAARFFRTLPRGSVIMGQEAPRLALDTGFPTIMAYEDWFNDRDPFERYQPSHLVVLDRFGGAELAWICRRFPQVCAKLRLIQRFPVWDTTISLYRVR